jgi:serine/threonine protein phosphatase PrpC
MNFFKPRAAASSVDATGPKSLSAQPADCNGNLNSGATPVSPQDSLHMRVRLSFRTDIGGMGENQDDCFIWKHEKSNSVVMGVLDGHGRDVGQLAAQYVKRFSIKWLGDHWDEVLNEPAEALRTMFDQAHNCMLAEFEATLKQQGWVVKLSNGYLMKRRGITAPWMCVHGGTSATLVAIVEGTHILTANVGDSSALLGISGRYVCVEDVVQHSLWDDGGGVLPPCRDPGTVGDISSQTQTETTGSMTLVLTADHSPESPREFCRMRKSHPSPCDPLCPHILVVYDSPPTTTNRQKYSAVFELNEAGDPCVTGHGRYYKNVRREWASLVATPPRARFQDALAFTRSIGDFHLQTYGVSHVPDVMSIDIPHIFRRPQASSASDAEMVVCILTCSDGIWDNWGWPEVTDFFLHPARLRVVLETNSSEQAVEEFMAENRCRARANFGSQADNATAIICYLFISSSSSSKQIS